MFVKTLIWLDDIVEKIIDKHSVTSEEVEEVFFNAPRFFFQERGHVENEHMYSALGRTNDGRYLAVFFVLKPVNRALIISARDMDRAERRRYGRK